MAHVIPFSKDRSSVKGIRDLANITKTKRAPRPAEDRVHRHINRLKRPFTSWDIAILTGTSIHTVRIILRILEGKAIAYVGRNKFGFAVWRRL